MQEQEKKRKLKKLIVSFSEIVREFSELNSLSSSEIVYVIEKAKEKTAKSKTELCPVIPLDAFKKNFGCLESISLYLKDKLNLKFSEISKLTNRDQRTIWVSYSKAKKKELEELKIKKTNKKEKKKKNNDSDKEKSSLQKEYSIPVSAVSDRNLSALESVVVYLKEIHNLSFTGISVLLKKAPQNIWTAYKKACSKKEGRQ